MIRLTGQQERLIRIATPGKSNKQIAFEMQLSPNTIGVYMGQIYGKLRRAGLDDGRWGLIMWAQQNGYGAEGIHLVAPSFEKVRGLVAISRFTLGQTRALVILLLERCPPAEPLMDEAIAA